MAISEIDVDELADLIAAADSGPGALRLVDVREPDEYAEAHVPGAILVPLSSVPDHLDQFAGDGTTYVICKGGGRSMRACELAAQEGHDVANVTGGTLAWIMSGRDVASGGQ